MTPDMNNFHCRTCKHSTDNESAAEYHYAQTGHEWDRLTPTQFLALPATRLAAFVFGTLTVGAVIMSLTSTPRWDIAALYGSFTVFWVGAYLLAKWLRRSI